MEKTRLQVTGKSPETFNVDLLIYCVAQPKKGAPKCDTVVKNYIEKAHKFGDFSGRKSQRLLFYPELTELSDKLQAKRVLIIGLGDMNSETSPQSMKEHSRVAGGEIAQEAEKCKAAKLMVVLPAIKGLSPRQVATALTEGILLRDYRFSKYKKTKEDDKPYGGIKELLLNTKSSQAAVKNGMKEAQIMANSSARARDMANEPANSWTPNSFGVEGRRIAKQYGMKCRILGKKDMVRLGMGGILGVNQGSSLPPKMVIIDYRPSRKNAQTLLFVGKGLTFDSGGVSMKPAAGMEDMKYDMCGGAAVLSLMKAVGEVKPAHRIVGIIPATENMVSGSALKPGDIIRHYNGLNSEIINTDAEGRLILADALAYGVKKYKPDCIVDLATLTGAVIIGLGHHHTGLLSNNDKLVERLIAAGKESGEPLWRLPLNADYSRQLKSDVADVKNIGGRSGGTITAAAYLEKFVDETPWAHLDIAGTAWNFTEKSYIPKGPSGVGVRVLIELVKNWKRSSLGK